MIKCTNSAIINYHIVFSMAMATVSAVGLWYFKTAIIPAMAAAFAYSAMTVLAYDAQQLYVFQKYETEVRYFHQCCIVFA